VTFGLTTPSAMQSAPISPGVRERPDRERRRGRATLLTPRWSPPANCQTRRRSWPRSPRRRIGASRWRF